MKSDSRATWSQLTFLSSSTLVTLVCVLFFVQEYSIDHVLWLPFWAEGVVPLHLHGQCTGYGPFAFSIASSMNPRLCRPQTLLREFRTPVYRLNASGSSRLPQGLPLRMDHRCNHAMSLASYPSRRLRSSPHSHPVVRYSESETSEEGPDCQQQVKLSNMGSMIDNLKDLVPQLLHKSFPKNMVLSDVLLRICPSHLELFNSYLPTIKGRVSYYATCKAIQMFFTSWVLNPRVKLHIQLIRTSHFPEANCVYSHSTKIYVRWSTCSDGCTHLLEPEPEAPHLAEGSAQASQSTSKATLGSHRWASFDTEKFAGSSENVWSLSTSLADLTKGIIGVKQEDIRLERIILGVFIFELNEDNTEILVHTVEDMNVVEHEQEALAQQKLRVC